MMTVLFINKCDAKQTTLYEHNTSNRQSNSMHDIRTDGERDDALMHSQRVGLRARRR